MIKSLIAKRPYFREGKRCLVKPYNPFARVRGQWWIDRGHKGIVSRHNMVLRGGEPLYFSVTLKHIRNTIDDGEHPTLLQVRVVVGNIRGNHDGTPRSLDAYGLKTP
jgi:hypothetical protein